MGKRNISREADVPTGMPRAKLNVNPNYRELPLKTDY
jgi:hypothetical protein